MLTVLKILARLGLVLTIIPSILFLMGHIELGEMKSTMLTGSVLWLITAPRLQILKQYEQRET